nr:preprotein translocase subunit SecG [Armatimonas sp.]
MNIVIGILTGALLLLSLSLILVVTLQNPKNEGLGGGVANTPSSSFRGKAGYDEILSVYTRNIVITWMSTALLLYILHEMSGA